jgi:Ca2+-binding RTX toxin-like protein
MATLTGTNGNDTLTGSEFIDTFYGLDGDDTMLLGGARAATSYWPGQADLAYGGNGSDRYQVDVHAIGGVIIEDNGLSNSNADTITGLGALAQQPTGRSHFFSDIERVGDDLHIVTAPRQSWFRHPGIRSVDITVVNQYAANGSDKIEYLVADGLRYNLITGNTGTNVADIIAGSNTNDTFSAKSGNDYVTGNGGQDKLMLGLGDDFGFGGAGNDRIWGGNGGDYIDGGIGNDKIYGGSGSDQIKGGEGRDVIRAGNQADIIDGDEGNDRLFGQKGNDRLTGGAGDDRLYGGTGADSYIFQYNSGAGWGNDIIDDRSTNAANSPPDTIELRGVYGPDSAAQAIEKLSIARNGNDMVIATTNGAASITVQNQFATTGVYKSYIEKLLLNGSNWSALQYQIRSSQLQNLGDDRGLAGKQNELMFGTDTDDTFFGASGTNLIWTGGGADVLLYKQVDPYVWYNNSIIYSSAGATDVVMDFDITLDKLDFSQIAAIGSMADLSITTQADGDAQIYWGSGSLEIANLVIELRGVNAADLTASSFVFATAAPVLKANTAADAGTTPINGTQDNDVLNGTGGNDVINGFGGADTIDAGAGNDVITGGAENDLLAGGSGQDTFVFGNEDGADVVRDYISGTDHIQLSQSEFITTPADALARVSYQGGNAILDITGGEQTVTFEGVSALALADFTIV